MDGFEALVAITSLLLPVVIVPVAMGMRLRQRKREWEHLERMKSLEMGVSVPDHAQASGVVAIGAGVPIAALAVGCLATVVILSNRVAVNIHTAHGGVFSDSSTSVPLLGIIWGTVVTVSLFALIIALILGVIQARALSNASQSSVWAHSASKPPFDPEAYEFAGHRG